MTEKLLELKNRVLSNEIGTAKPWGGAGVQIVEVSPENVVDGFYPDPRSLETEFVAELSWLFEEIRNVFSEFEGFGQWKEELFGRLSNVALKYQSLYEDPLVRSLLLALLEEVDSLMKELLLTGTISTLLITHGNLVLDDLTSSSDRNSYLRPDESRAIFLKHGYDPYQRDDDIAAASPKTIDNGDFV